jgi:hypothetical protein
LQRSFTSAQVAEAVSSVLKRGLASILVCANLCMTRVDAEEKVASKIGARLKSIAEAALKLNKIVGQAVTPSDLKVALVSPGERYHMETMESDYDVEESEKIISSFVRQTLG